MTKRITVLLAAVVLTSNLALSQETGKPNSTKQDHPQTWTASTKALTVSGKVSEDGKLFATDIDSEWAINNPDAVKGHEGRLVTIKCYVDPEKSKIHVLSVRTPQYAAMHSDSAFRR